MYYYVFGERSDHCPEGAVGVAHYDLYLLFMMLLFTFYFTKVIYVYKVCRCLQKSIYDLGYYLDEATN